MQFVTTFRKKEIENLLNAKVELYKFWEQ